jgi:hypothetical protein
MVDPFKLVAPALLRSDEDIPLPVPPGEDPPSPIGEPPDEPIVGPDGPVRDPGPREPQRL